MVGHCSISDIAPRDEECGNYAIILTVLSKLIEVEEIP